ncbi:unnamed protein product [Closterium sp. Yama58-4]|nr:unnamed protein product [Closterium sp. Yama58-4]
MALTLFDQTAAPAAVVQPLGSVAEWFRALMGKDSGVLYEDPHLQIGVKSEWKPPHGRVVLFLGNKGTAPLTALTASTPPTPGLRVILSPLPQVIPPRAQIQLPVEAAAVLVPREAPRLDMAYTLPSGTRVPLRLHLPVALSKALLPASLSSADFFARWKTLSAPPHKQQVVLRGVKPLPLPALAQLLASMHINPLPNLDPNPNNIVACCTLHTETTPPTLLLARLETDPADRSQLRLTCASSDPTASAALRDFISDNISELPPAWLQPPPVAAQQQQGGAAMLALPWSGAPAAAVSSPPGPTAVAPSPAAPHMVLPGGAPPPAAGMAPMPYGSMPMQGPGMGMAAPMGMGVPGEAIQVPRHQHQAKLPLSLALPFLPSPSRFPSPSLEIAFGICCPIPSPSRFPSPSLEIAFAI